LLRSLRLPFMEDKRKTTAEIRRFLKDMAAYISRRKSILIGVGALCLAAGAAALLNFLLAGPRLGPWYDFLLQCRSAPPAAREILLIDAESLIEPGDVLPLVITMAELDAGGLLIQAPVLGLASGRDESEADMRRRFDDEFALLGRNIRNLFDAIRMGSIPPGDLGRYVENLVELAERGKERLSSALVRQDEAGTRLLEQAAAAYGKVRQMEGIRPFAAAPSLSGDGSRQPRPGEDGKLRRMDPLLIPGAGLNLEYEETGPVISGKKILLDPEGRLIFDKSPPADSFRRVSLDLFRDYEKTSRSLAALLRGAEPKGIYSGTRPELSPVYLYDHSLALREDFLEKPGPETRDAWVKAAAEYLAGLDKFLNGPAESALVRGYEELIATERLRESGIKRLQGLRDELIRTFAEIREQHQTLQELRGVLETVLPGSFCIMGPPEETWGAASLANALLTGRAIRPGFTRYILFWSILAAVLVICTIFSLSPFRALFAGTLLTLLCGAVFSWSFIISAYWIDPLIPVSAAFTGVLTIFACSFIITRRGSRRFRLAYGPYVNRSCLKQLIQAGRPQPAEVIRARAAIVAVRNGEIPALQDKGSSLAGAQAARKFRNAAAEFFKRAGAVIIGVEGDMVLAAFGSPLERLSLEQTKSESPYKDDPLLRSPHNPAARAAGFVADLIAENPGLKSWRFGLDTGECAFAWSTLSGYAAYGRPAVRARVLSSLAIRFRARVLITGAVNERLEVPARKLSSLSARGEKEFFYELPVGP
jgi:class 3 adenylate cyclase